MRKFCFSILVFCLMLFSAVAHADDEGVLLAEVFDVYQTVGQFCGGISDRLSDISGVSKANTAVSAVGTVAAGGALAVGIAKAQTDKKIEELSKQLCADGGCNPDTVATMSDEDFFNIILPTLVEIMVANQEGLEEKIGMKQEIDEKTKKSKKLGNWRTGLLAGTVGTNVASAVLSGLNRNQSDLIQQITACNEAVSHLRTRYNEVSQFGLNPVENPVMKNFYDTINSCGTLEITDVEKIEKRMTAIMGTSIGGAAIGAIGMGTSIAANTDKIRNDNSEKGKQKEKALNTVSNVAAGVNVATGAVGTGLNISLITLTKKLIKAAELCEGTL